jgi:hypothetical protein
MLMTRPLPRWLPPAFTAVLVACLQFVVLTLAAMALYPGGTVADPTVARYSFVRNFFSDLGRTVSPLGEPNLAAAVLFAVALALAGAGLALFFLATPWFFTHSRGLGLVSGLGSVFGVLSGLSFMGVAFTPANLLLEAHRWFVLTAFRTFLPPVICYSVAILASRRVPNRFALVYLGFAALLAAYLQLLVRGPALDSAAGLIVQATGQKIIVYAAILCIGIQAAGARRLVRSQGTRPAFPRADRSGT